eukprot:Gb_27685 [translate_table: standard]
MSAGPDGDIERVEVGFRHHLGYMLITPTSEVSADDSARGAEVYGKVAVTEEGKQAALLLCAEDWNCEVVDWLLNSAVSRLAREFHGGAHASTTEEKKFRFSEQSSVRLMVRDIVEKESMKEFNSEIESQDLLDELGQWISEEVPRPVPVRRDEESWDDGVLWGAITRIVTHMAVLKKAKLILKKCALRKETYEFDVIAIQKISGKSHELDAVLWGNVRIHILRLAAGKADAQVVQKLLDCGAQGLETDDQKKTALHHCAASKYDNEGQILRSEKVLLEKISNKEELVEACDAEGRTALHIASSSGHPLVCELLLRHGANLNAKDKSGQIPLHYAVKAHLNAKDQSDPIRNKKQQEVVDVLIKREIIDSLVISTSIVDSEDNEGKTPLDIAAAGNNLQFLEILLSRSKRAQIVVQKKDSGNVLRQSAREGYTELVGTLLENGANPLDRDVDGKKTLHYAADGADKRACSDVIFCCIDSANIDLTRVVDKNGRTVLHAAVSRGHANLCGTLLLENSGLYMCKDRDGQIPLHYAVKQNNEAVVKALLENCFEDDKQRVDLRDLSGMTPLHIAAAQGNFSLAARKGHKLIVEKLLQSGSRRLQERDCDGKTALHYAVQLKDGNDAVAIAKVLFNYCKSKEEKVLLLWASAVGIGTAQESLTRENMTADDPIKVFLEHQKKELQVGTDFDLLRTAASLGYIDMTQELLTRGGTIFSLRDHKLRESLKGEEEENVRKVVQKIDKITEQASEQPTLSNNLGRNILADGLAALFLNPYVKSPITVGISGEWGMGKSSLMLQTEMIMLKTAAQLAFPKLLEVHQGFPGAEELNLTKQGEKKCQKIRRSLELFLATDQESTTKENRLVNFLENYQQKYHAVYKSLAVIDRSDMIKRNSKRPDSNNEGMTEESVPAILTVCYNAWKYRNEREAWAGLAVEITKEMEETMTLAQWLSTCWRTTKRSIWVGQILPCLLAAALACFLTWLAWLFLDRSKQKGLDYGSLAATIIVIVWTLVKSIMVVLKPISSQIADYVSLPDLTQTLGYHQQVIKDINLLKEEIGKPPNWLCTIITCLWCWIRWDWSRNNIRDTRIPKMAPQFKDEAVKEENIPKIDGSKERKQSSDVDTQKEDIPTPERLKEREQSSAPKTPGEPLKINMPENENEAQRSDPVVASRCLCPIGGCIGSILHTFGNQPKRNETPGEKMNSEKFLVKYTSGEKNAFYYFETLATGIRRLPREWKRMLNYHRLAWNVFFKSNEAKYLAGWQVQLIAWIFVCWQWKDRINTLIETWHKLDILRNWADTSESPSLRVIVDRYIEEKHKTLERPYPAEGEDKKKTANGHKEDSKEREHRGRGDPEKGKRKGLKQVAGEEELEDWEKLRESLSRYDVSMDGIQAFQKFRFYCNAGYLRWPIPNSSFAMKLLIRGGRCINS